MIKRLKNFFVILLLVSISTLPLNAKAVTLQEYENEVAKYQAQINEKKAQLAKNNETIASVQARIKDYQSQITKNEEEQQKLQEEIDKSNEEIKKKTSESKKLVEYYQISNGSNTYFEYIFGATSITDMIYRMSVVEQLTDYNDKIMKELNKLIEKNKKNQVELKNKKEELKKLKADQEAEQKKIEQDSKNIEGTIPNIEGDLKTAQARVTYYKNKGCKSSDRIGVDCDRPKPVTPSGGGSSGGGSSGGNIISANGFTFPVSGGHISQSYGNRGHKGVDIGKGCGAPIKAVAAGRVYYVGNTLDNYGAKMVIIVHNVNGRLVFSQYAHLSGYAVSSGQDVSVGQTIGYMGNTGYSFGCHLHLEMSEDYGWNYNSSYYTYIRHIINPFKYVPY